MIKGNDVIGFILTGVLLVFMWLGHTWALYLLITLVAIDLALVTVLTRCHTELFKLHCKKED